MLAENKIAYDKRDFFKQGFTVAELKSLLKSLHLKAHDVVATKSPAYKKMGLDRREVSDEELLALMVEEPRLLRRPLIVETDPKTGQVHLVAASLGELKKSLSEH